MLFQPKIILKQILISITGMDTRISKHSSVIAIFHTSQQLEYDFMSARKVFDHLTRSQFSQCNNMTDINDL
jgi:hypothetical protein